MKLNFQNHVKIPKMVLTVVKKDEWGQNRHKVVKTGLKKVKMLQKWDKSV